MHQRCNSLLICIICAIFCVALWCCCNCLFIFQVLLSYFFAVGYCACIQPLPTSHMHLMDFELNRFRVVFFFFHRSEILLHILPHLNDVVGTGFIGLRWMDDIFLVECNFCCTCHFITTTKWKVVQRNRHRHTAIIKSSNQLIRNSWIYKLAAIVLGHAVKASAFTFTFILYRCSSSVHYDLCVINTEVGVLTRPSWSLNIHNRCLPQRTLFHSFWLKTTTRHSATELCCDTVWETKCCQIYAITIRVEISASRIHLLTVNCSIDKCPQFLHFPHIFFRRMT